MNNSFEFTTTLEYSLKSVANQLYAFKTGEKYVQMKTEYTMELRHLEKVVRNLQNERSKAHSEIITSRNHWFEVFEDLEKENSRDIYSLRCLVDKMEQRTLNAERQLDATQDKITQQRHQIYDLATQLEEEKGKNLKLKAQMNRYYENSSIPSSKLIKNKKISNSREKTDPKLGAQPGHKGYGRKKQIPTAQPVLLNAPQEVLDDPDFKKTYKTIVKQLVKIRLLLDVKEYHADVYYNSKT